MKSAVFGAGGWIGSSLVHHLRENGDEVIEASPGLSLNHVDIAYYLISTVSPATAEGKFAEVLEQEKRLLHSVLKGLSAETKIIFASSGGTVYGDGLEPHAENEELRPLSDYGRCKKALEEEVLTEAKAKGRSIGIARIANPYGPWPKSRAPFGAINTFVDQAARGNNLQLFGEGTTTRDFLHVNDVASALRWIGGLSKNSFEIYNVGSGQGRNLADVIDAIDKLIPVKIDRKPDRPFDIHKNVLDNSRLRDSGWCAKWEFAEGLRSTLEWRKSW